jgi:hypothetical protein
MSELYLFNEPNPTVTAHAIEIQGETLSWPNSLTKRKPFMNHVKARILNIFGTGQPAIVCVGSKVTHNGAHCPCGGITQV